VTGADIVVDGQDIQIPLAETPLPTHQCWRCGMVAGPR
jgi:hypothetical protein